METLAGDARHAGGAGGVQGPAREAQRPRHHRGLVRGRADQLPGAGADGRGRAERRDARLPPGPESGPHGPVPEPRDLQVDPGLRVLRRGHEGGRPLHRAPAQDHRVHGAEAARAAPRRCAPSTRPSGSGPRPRRSAPFSDERRALPRGERPPCSRAGRRSSSGTASSPTGSSIARPAGWRPASPGAGLRPGERVCLHLANRPEFVLAYYGCQKLGVTPVALNVTYAREELRYIIRDSEAAAILSAPPFAAQLPEARRHADRPGARGHRRAGGDRLRGPRRPIRRSGPSTATARIWRRSSTPRPPPAGPRASC